LSLTSLEPQNIINEIKFDVDFTGIFDLDNGMRNIQLDQNLKRIIVKLAEHEPGQDGDKSEADKIAWNVPLAHSTSTLNLTNIIASGKLISHHRLMQVRGITSDPDNPTPEEILGTDDYVFLFAGPFRYTASGCGFIFHADLEKTWSGRGEASPFDSGGLISIFTGFTGSPRDYLDRFRLPLYRHREYLAGKLRLFFPKPRAYIEPNIIVDVFDPITGLRDGDPRRWIHEVRLKNELDIRSHLEAVFYRKSSAGLTDVEHFLVECQDQGVYTEAIEAPYDQEFDVMLNCCCDYIKGIIGV